MIPQLAAPAHWERIDLLSDLHLGPDTPGTLARFGAHLANTPAHAVLLLGDIFEAWVGDDARHEYFEAGVVRLLREASQRLALFFMPGNRDFLVGPEFLADTGMTALPDPTVLVAFGQRWLLAHGDGQCLDDAGYQAWRETNRSSAWQADFLAKPLADRQAFGREARAQSRASQAAQLMATDLDAEACRALLAEADATIMIHGHTHRPAAYDLGDGLRRVVLSDWDFEATPPRGDVICLSAMGLQRLPL